MDTVHAHRPIGTLTGSQYTPTGITDSGKVLFDKGVYDTASGTYTPADADYTPIGIDKDGRMCANWNCSGGCTLPRIKDQSGSWVDIDQLPDYPLGFNRAEEMNQNGQICGNAYDFSNNRQAAFLWNGPGDIINIAAPTGYQLTRCKGMNSNGWVIGEAGYCLNDYWYYDAFIWHQDQGFTMISPGNELVAIDINDSNQVIGSTSNGLGYNSWVWDEKNGFTALPGIGAIGINDQGWIVGNRYNGSDTGCSAVLLKPVPEPSSLAAMLCGIIFTGRIRRRS